MRRLLLLLLCLPLPALAGGGASCRVDAVPVANRLHCLHAGRALSVDLRGIRVPADDAAAETARQRLSELVLGREIRLLRPQRLATGHWRAAVWSEPLDCPGCGQTLDCARALLTTGSVHFQPDPALSPEEAEQYRFEEDEARARHHGLWAAPGNGPSEPR
ncbi:MAG: hypothetical protein GAK43_01631 [Stenotrophomonas maltophilia]|nr:MAG: hypothetical protein GAK43_01631 [Stenotrophomonas maltophilia]